MKRLYIAVLTLLTACIFLFIASFFYLDKMNHQTYHYTVRWGDREVGSIKIDRYSTEGKIIWKSATSLPFEPLYSEYRSRLVTDNKYNLESYTRERISGKVMDMIYLENFKNMISFVSRFQSRFSCVENINVRQGTFVFEEDSPATYMPIIDNYDFSQGHSQGFHAISCLQSWSLPPMKRFITFTSIKDEYIKIGSHNIKTENLIIKIRNYPQSSVWVSKSDRSIIRIEIPSRNITIERTFRQKTVKASAIPISNEGYLSKEVLIKSAGVDISGTFSYPSSVGRFPGVLLIPGSAPLDRNYAGLFSSLAGSLSKRGYAVLRYDKRGVGSSSGEIGTYTDSLEQSDIRTILSHLSSQAIVDPGRLFLIAHGTGAERALRIAVEESSVKGVVMMSPALYSGDESFKLEDIRRAAQKGKWSDEYLQLVNRTIKETQQKLSGKSDGWTYILGKRCFLGKTSPDTPLNKLDWTANPELPVLILQGKGQDEPLSDMSAYIDKIVSDSGDTKHTLSYYAYLGQYFGPKTSDGKHKYHYPTDKEVTDNISAWLDNISVVRDTAAEADKTVN